jgi:adenylate cyclase
VKEGFIDYSVGAPIRYVAMHEVAAMPQEALERTFRDRIVIVGNLTKDVDRWTLPVLLLERDPEPQAGSLVYNQPGVLTHAQVVRSHLASGLVDALHPALAAILAAAFALSVLVHARARWVVGLAVAVPAAILAASLVLIVRAQILLPVATLVAAFVLGLGARALFDAVQAVLERLRLQQAFAGQVSPAVMREMLGGGLSPGVSGQLAEVCVLFSDVRDFTTLSEHLPPQAVTQLLQRYFDRMVRAVHRYDGTVDKFIGDGMMVLFGAPRKSIDPCGDAVQCALAMMGELDRLNQEFAGEGLPVLTIGIGINYGTVTVGNIGSSERHNYSAIGDAVNVAARVEGLTKDLGRKIIITEAVVARIESQRFQFDPLGRHKVKGHSPVEVWGIRTARVAPAAIEAEAAT